MALGQFNLNGVIGFPSSRQIIALNGGYFTVTNPTVGTGVVWATLATASATANGFVLVSNGAAAGGKTIVFDRLEIKQTATAPTATLSMNFEAWNEIGIVAFTGNAAARTPVQMNTGISQTTVATVQMFSAGAGTVPAAVGTRRMVDTAQIATGLTFIKDSFALDFGQDGPTPSIPGLTAARLTTPLRASSQMGPVVVAPQTTTWLNMWWDATATNVPSFEYRFSYFEV
jgi:hypothetical protein